MFPGVVNWCLTPMTKFVGDLDGEKWCFCGFTHLLNELAVPHWEGAPLSSYTIDGAISAIFFCQSSLNFFWASFHYSNGKSFYFNPCFPWIERTLVINSLLIFKLECWDHRKIFKYARRLVWISAFRFDDFSRSLQKCAKNVIWSLIFNENMLSSANIFSPFAIPGIIECWLTSHQHDLVTQTNSKEKHLSFRYFLELIARSTTTTKNAHKGCELSFASLLPNMCEDGNRWTCVSNPNNVLFCFSALVFYLSWGVLADWCQLISSVCSNELIVKNVELE